ncbi:MAG: rod shape-determining protein RodA [Acidimicrobiales bacterium]|nr:rod shape-determining protein RodA [Acidimicrobiales bacterium]
MAVASPLSGVLGGRGADDPAAPARHVDLALVGASLALAGLGLLMVYSSTRGLSGATYAVRQGVFVALGAGVMALTALVDYRWIRDRIAIFYALSLAGLALVVSPLGSESKGAQAWFQLGGFQLQPSELAKVVLVVTLATVAAAGRGELDGRRLLGVLVVAGIPMGLIMLQPDLGTALVFAAILAGILVVAGARARHLLVLAMIGVVGVAAVLNLGVLKEYQRDRLTAFLDQEADSQQSTYNLEQSKIAIGAGGLVGRGLFQGTQTNLDYVPEQHTDFIFTVVGEELGFAGGATLLLLYGVMAWRIWRAAQLARDLTGTLICVGVLAMLVFQVFQNVGMTMGIMPITGIPLPLLSYGGSSTLAFFAAIGLVVNVHMRRFT